MLGAGGLTGTECIKRLAELGIVARAVVRTPDKYREKLKAIDPKAGFILADKAGPCASTHVLSAGFRLRLWQAMSRQQRVLQQRCKELVALFLPPVARLSSLQALWTSRCLLEPAEIRLILLLTHGEAPQLHSLLAGRCQCGNSWQSCRP